MSIGYLTANDGDEYARHIEQDVTIDGYTPRNNKCYCYPYCYIELTNNNNNSIQLKWENFNANEGKAYFQLFSTLSTSPSISVYPRAYKGLTDNIEHSVTYKDFPQVPFKYGVFTNWFALNENQLDFGVFKAIYNTATEIASSGTWGAIMPTLGQGAMSLVSQQMMIEDKSKTPDKIVGENNGNFLMQQGYVGIYVNKVVAKAEYIETIDNFFTRFGYQVNTTKAITITNRENFDYVQTTECNLTGDIPQEDIEELEAIFNSGLTIWHNENTYGDWNVSNRGWGDIS